MAAGDPNADPRKVLSEGIRQIRESLAEQREGAVAILTQRNNLMAEAELLIKQAADYEEKARLARSIQRADLAVDIESAAAARRAEAERLQVQIALLDAQATNAALAVKTAEATASARLAALQEKTLAALTSTGSAADEMWDRATAKIQSLVSQAEAATPQAAVMAAQAEETERSVEQMLANLEKRAGTRPGSESTQHVTAQSASIAAPAYISGKEDSRMDPKRRVKVAAIGTGGIFRGAHLPAHVELPQLQLVAFVDPDKTAQDLVHKRYRQLIEVKVAAAREKGDHDEVARLESDFENIRIFEDIQQVIEMKEDRPELLDVCTQPVLHAPLSIQGLEAGFHVMCEKPISRSWLESQRVIEAVKRTGQFYQHNENWLFDPDYYTVKKLVDAGQIGELIAMFLNQSHGGPEGNPRFWNSDFGGGGALLDNGIHAIGAAWFITGLEKTPTFVKAAQPFGMSIRMPNRIIEGRYQKVTVDDDAHILIRFENSENNEWSTAHVEGSWSEKDSADTCYIGSTGRIDMINEDGKRFAVVTDSYGNVSRKLRVSGSNWQHWPSSFYGEIQNMVECIRIGQQSLMTAEFGADCSAIVGASYLSEMRGKKPVHLNEFKAFANEIADRYPNDPVSADNALVDALLSAVRNK